MIWDIVAEHGHGVVDDSSDDLCLPSESMSEPQAKRTRLTTLLVVLKQEHFHCPRYVQAVLTGLRLNSDTSDEQAFQSPHSLVRNDPVVAETVFSASGEWY